jgi:hypothetical protein
MTTTTDLNAKMATIQGLLAKADSTTFPAEQAELLAKAEMLMRKYRVAEEDLIASDTSAVMPGMVSMLVHSYHTPYAREYMDMLSEIVHHVGLIGVRRASDSTKGETYGRYMDVFGYDGDLRMVTWLWSAARLVFASHLEPEYNPKASEQVNAYNMRAAGMLRKDIAERLLGENTPANRSRIQRLYLAECAYRGEQPAVAGLGTDAATYRRGYARGFVDRLVTRLRLARDAADVAGGALVFKGRAERINALMYSVYPHLDPANRQPTAGVVAPVSTACERCDRNPSGGCKKHPARKLWTQADEAKWQRQNTSQSAVAGQRAGAAAAAKVEVNRTQASAQRVDTAGRAPIALG